MRFDHLKVIPIWASSVGSINRSDRDIGQETMLWFNIMLLSTSEVHCISKSPAQSPLVSDKADVMQAVSLRENVIRCRNGSIAAAGVPQLVVVYQAVYRHSRSYQQTSSRLVGHGWYILHIQSWLNEKTKIIGCNDLRAGHGSFALSTFITLSDTNIVFF